MEGIRQTATVRAGGFTHTDITRVCHIGWRVLILMAFLYQGTVCTEVTVHSIISTGQTAAPDDAEAAPNCCFITQKRTKKKPSLLPVETPHMIQRQP